MPQVNMCTKRNRLADVENRLVVAKGEGGGGGGGGGVGEGGGGGPGGGRGGGVGGGGGGGGGGGEEVGWTGSLGLVDANSSIQDEKQQGPTVWHRELYSISTDKP